MVDLIKKEQLENRVFLLGKIDEDNIYHYYNNCKIFVLPSTHKSEAFGIVQIEAMSFGKPIVSTEIKGSGVDWVNENNESGIVVNIKDSKQISEAILEICTDEETYRTYSKKSLHRYNSFFTLNSMVKNIEQTYNSLMGI